jgi:hypothetical protein
MERTEVLDLMGELKLYGMRQSYDEVMSAGLKRQHPPPQIVGDLLKAEISEKQARSIKYQMTIAGSPTTATSSRPATKAGASRTELDRPTPRVRPSATRCVTPRAPRYAAGRLQTPAPTGSTLHADPGSILGAG